MSTKPNASPASRRPTIVDVAHAAGVSIKTVSRVVNDVPTVRPDLVDRVQAAITELGYRRNDAAARLRSGVTTGVIGLLIEDLANPFYSTVASAVAEVARRRDTILIVASSEEDPAREHELLLDLCDRRVDGLVVVPAGPDHSFLRAEIEKGTPAVFLDRPPGGLLADTVLLDNAGGARAAIERLLEQGHERIGIIADSLAIHTVRERIAGAQAALADAGLSYDDALVREDIHDPRMAAQAVGEMLDRPSPPTAFFCVHNRITVGALDELWRRDSDAALVGFDDFELSHLMPRPVTVIAHDPRELGRKAAELLFRRVDGDRSWPTTTVLPTRLIDRGTGPRTGPNPG